ncbi:MAG: TetR/AcrR family transcriptional regulator [Spirochaetales bacterium]|nr:TetR/AcrR family transcriptional regulator [Spirochaetales bacterium]
MAQTMEVRILEGASSLFYRFGFSRVRFSEIAKEVGITTRTIYNYFPNKLSLSKAVSEYSINQMLNELSAIVEKKLPFPETTVSSLKVVYRELNKRLPAYHKDSSCQNGEMNSQVMLDPDISGFFRSRVELAVKEGYYEKDAPFDMMMQILLCQVHYCFPMDRSLTTDRVDEDYFINSILLILSTCATDKGRQKFNEYFESK